MVCVRRQRSCARAAYRSTLLNRPLPQGHSYARPLLSESWLWISMKSILWPYGSTVYLSYPRKWDEYRSTLLLWYMSLFGFQSRSMAGGRSVLLPNGVSSQRDTLLLHNVVAEVDHNQCLQKKKEMPIVLDSVNQVHSWLQNFLFCLFCLFCSSTSI